MAEVAEPRESFQAILDWAAEIVRGGIRMKAERVKIEGEYWKPRRRYLRIREKQVLRAQKSIETALCQRITGTD
jgi:hypothetical protein